MTAAQIVATVATMRQKGYSDATILDHIWLVAYTELYPDNPTTWEHLRDEPENVLRAYAGDR